MDDDKTQPIGVKKEMLKEAESIHYECKVSHWQMFEILVSFCKDCPNEFSKWKKNKLGRLKKQWEKKQKKLSR